MTDKLLSTVKKGDLSILCSVCKAVVKNSEQLDKYERAAVKGKLDLPAQYCNEHQNTQNVNGNRVHV